MANFYRWNIGSGTFDTPGNWVNVDNLPPVATQSVPGAADTALIDPTAATIAGAGAAVGTLDVSGTESLTGLLEFGNLNVGWGNEGTLFPNGGATTLTLAAGMTLEQVASLDTTPTTSFAILLGADGTAVVDVAGAGAALLAAGTGELGIGAGSTLNVDAGGTASAATSVLFGGSGGTATLDVSGAGAVFDAASWLIVGDGGSADFFLSLDAVADVGQFNLGYDPGTATASNDVAQITSGATLVATGSVELAAGSSDVATLFVAFPGAEMISHGLYVGDTGHGTISVQAGGTLVTLPLLGDATSFGGSVATSANSAGEIVVTGSGSKWSLESRYVIGGNAAGTLEVLSGAAVATTLTPVAVVQSGTTVALDASLAFDHGVGLVDGTGATLDTGGGPLWVGNVGTANLTIEQGGQVTAGSDLLGFAAMSVGLDGGTGLVTLENSGSRLTVVGQMEVGGLSAGSNTSELIVEAGATAVTGFSSLDVRAGFVVGSGPGSVGYATIEGAGSVLLNSGRFDIGELGNGSLLISGGAAVSTSLVAAAQSSEVAGMLVGVDGGASGLVEVTGVGSSLTVAQSAVVGFETSATLDVLAGASLSVGRQLVVGNTNGYVEGGHASGDVAVDGSGSTLSVGGALALGETLSATGYSGTGTLAVTDSAYASIAGPAVLTAGSTLSVDNSGKIEIGGSGHGTAATVVIDAGGTLSGAGLVSANVLNNGTVIATGGTLKLTNTVQGSGVADIDAGGTLELGGVALNTVAMLGRGTLKLDAGASFAGTLALAASGGTIDLAGQTVTKARFSGADLLATLSGGGVVSLLTSGVVAGTGVTVRGDGGTGSDLTVACFARGTAIRTSLGDVAVEHLRVGDMAVTEAGGMRPVVWIGHRTLSCARHPRPWDVRPVRVRAGAFAPELPARDLLLSPDHALHLDGHLIPVRYLLNGVTVTQEDVAEITYFHVELDRHDILLAEGLPAESYLDTNNRAAFDNTGDTVMLHPDFAGLAAWRVRGCASLALGGAPVATARRRLLRRAAQMGHTLVRDPTLLVLADGQPVPMRAYGDGRWLTLPPGTRAVRLRSRVYAPADRGEGDTRRLGFAIGRVWLDGVEIDRAGPAFASGWHAAEPDWRWTDGDATLLVAGARALSFKVAIAGRYWTTPAASHATGAARLGRPAAA